MAGPVAVDVEDGAGVRCCTGAVVLRYAGGAFRGVVVVAGIGGLSSSECGGRGGGALQGGAAAGSGATTSSIACGVNLAVGDSARCRAGCLL